MTRKAIKEQAEQILKKYALPIPFRVGDLASYLGLTLQYCSPQDIISVASQEKTNQQKNMSDSSHILGYYNPSNSTIYINKDQSTKRLRFSIAHEIGHHTLHKTDAFRKVFVTQDIFSNDPKEIDANYFAGYLLMPDQEIHKRIPFIQLMGTSTDILKRLADMFGVSTDAMRIRLTTYKQENIDTWNHYNLTQRLF